MIDLTQHDELVIRQHVETLEVFTGFETRNRYSISTPDGQEVCFAHEESGGLQRLFLKTHRPLEINVIDADGSPVLTADRAFFWFLSHMNVRDGAGRPLGTLNREWGVFSRKFALTDSLSRNVGQILGSALRRRYTFFVHNPQGAEVGRITKEWAGLAREAFTDADTFKVEFADAARSQEFRLLLLAAAFAIDLDFFEK